MVFMADSVQQDSLKHNIPTAAVVFRVGVPVGPWPFLEGGSFSSARPCWDVLQEQNTPRLKSKPHMVASALRSQK